MCQKAMGGFFGPFVTAHNIEWTRGERKLFQSSNRAQRGFCADCGTPLTFEPDVMTDVEIAIGTLDRAEEVPPVVEANPEHRMPWFDELHKLPHRPASEQSAIDAFKSTITSLQHPDHDTKTWPPEEED
jgi:hypothetical protein